MAEGSTGQKLKVFISYSRRDASDFAEELVAGLELSGFAPFLDRQDIAVGEDWESRLGGLIQQADTVLFIISPEAVRSERCAWEVERALTESKRLLPVIYKPVAESDIPEQLRRRQFVRFDRGPGITRPLAELAEALGQDIEWIREHTRLGELTNRWQVRGRSQSLLLRGDELVAVQAWASHRKPGAPEITEAMAAFLAASKNAETSYLAKANAAQRRIIRMQAMTSVLLMGVIVLLIGWINQSFIKEQWRSYMTIRPFRDAKVRPYVISLVAEQKLKPKQDFKECAPEDGTDYCPEMIVLPAGTFTMGSPKGQGEDDEYPQHQVTIDRPLAVAKFELTFGEWDACATYGDCDQNIDDSGWGRGRQPTINVTWSDAVRYVEWLSRMTGKPYRLLSEAEWEYAARAGTQTVYFWGNQLGKGNANCVGCGSKWDGKQPAPVGSFAPNAFGLYDMHGNLREWVEDCYHTSYNGAPKDGSAWITDACHYRVVRDGSWGYPEPPRSAGRWRDTPSDRSLNTGFRVARTLGP